MFRLLKNILRLVVLLLVVGALLFSYARYIEPKTLHTVDAPIYSSYVSPDAEHLQIVAFADTHFSEYYTCEDFQKVIREVNELNPDIILFLGDLIDNLNEYEGDTGEISDCLAQLNASIGKFAVFGNHDYGGGSERHYEGIMENGGFTVLKNQYFGLDEYGIAIIGIDDVLIGHGSPDIASYARPDYFNVVLCHEPDLADEVQEYNIDLMLAGHTHGRQVDLSIFDDYILPPYGKKYVKGDYSFDNSRSTQLYVTSGLGTTKLPVRFLSPPEITHLLLKPADENQTE